MTRPTVVLPQPDSPTRPSVSPGGDRETKRRPPRARSRSRRREQPAAAHLDREIFASARPTSRIGRGLGGGCHGAAAPARGGSAHELAGTDLVDAVAGRGMPVRHFGPARPGPAHLSMRCGQRGAKRQPGGGAQQIGRQALRSSRSRVRARLIEPRHRAHQPDRVGMRGAAGKSRRPMPCSMMLAAYITFTRSA